MKITKRFFLAALTVMCAMSLPLVFTSCSSDDDDDVKTFAYAIGIEVQQVTWTEELGGNSEDYVSVWYKTVSGAYQTALGATGDYFSRTGKEAECDKKVSEDCKKAEETVKNLKGGSGIVTVRNTTTGKTVYSYQIQP